MQTKVIKKLNDSLYCDNLENQVVKRDISTSVNTNTDDSDHNFAQNPVDIINDDIFLLFPCEFITGPKLPVHLSQVSALARFYCSCFDII